MKRPLRVTVLGGGVGGLAAAFFLGAEENLEVTLIEREPRHDAHSSGRSAEILRTAIDHPVTEGLALETATLLRQPGLIGLRPSAALVDRRGLYVVTDGGTEAPWVQRHLERGEAKEVPPSEVARIAPHFRARGTRAWVLPGGGQIHGTRLLSALARGASQRGVRLLRSQGDAVPVLEGGRITGVDCHAERIPCDRLIVAAGAWSGHLGAAMGAPIPLRTTRRHMWVLKAHRASNQRSPRSAPIVWDDAAGFYARPEALPGSEWGWAFSHTDLDDHAPSPACEGPASGGPASGGPASGGPASEGPASGDYAIDPVVRAAALAAAREHLPSAGSEIVRSWRGFRDLGPDDCPILGADERVEGLHWCAGLGGHGMTISLGAGRAVAASVGSGQVAGQAAILGA